MFTELVNEITMLEVYEATRALPLEDRTVETPLATMTGKSLKGEDPVIVPILRAGLGMVEGMTKLLPTCRVGFLGMYRDEKTFQPVPYYAKFPDTMGSSPIFVLDPMLATGGSASAGIDFIKEQGGRDITMTCIVAARPGVERLLHDHPEVRIFAAAFDEELTPNAYITPGVGDAGDRLFGTI
jgi:uracil phosphoribosyltransferase